MVSNEAWDILEQANQFLERDNLSEKDCRNAISFILMAIEKAKEPFPEAHSFLVQVAVQLRDFELAAKHADIALQYLPYDFNSQFVKVTVAARKLKVFNAGNFIQQSNGGFLDTILGGAAYAHSAISQNAFKKEMRKLLDIFRFLTSQFDSSCYDYIMMASPIIDNADTLVSDKQSRRIFQELAKEMYTTAGSVDIRNLTYEEAEEQTEAQKIRMLAQGRMRLGR